MSQVRREVGLERGGGGGAALVVPVVGVVWRVAAPVAGELVWSVWLDNGHTRARCVLRVEGVERVLVDGAKGEVEVIDGLTHVQVRGRTGSGARLVLTLAGEVGDAGAGGLMYARTSLLEELGVPGGRAEPPVLGG